MDIKSLLVLICSFLYYIGCEDIIDPWRCHPDQINQETCTLLPYYNQYQKAICLDETQIHSRSNGRVKCESVKVGKGSAARSYCWYPQCQMGAYTYGFNPDVHPDCRCDEQSRDFCRTRLDRGKERCLKLPNYDTTQYVTCLSSREVLSKSYGTGCPFPQTHCWFSCQAARYTQPSGKVENDCKCTPSDGMSTKPRITLLVISLISLIIFMLL